MAEIIEQEMKAVQITSVMSKKRKQMCLLLIQQIAGMRTDSCVTCDAEHVIRVWDV